MDEDIYGLGGPHLQGKTVRNNIRHVRPIMVPNLPKVVLDKYKKVTQCCDLMHINGIGFLKTISRHIMFATGIMIKNKNKIILKMKLYRSTSYTCSVASKSRAYILIAILNLYVRKCLISEYPLIAHLRSNMSLRLSYSTGPSRNVSNLPYKPCLSNKYIN